MAIAINGSTNVITGISVGGLPDGIVDADMLASNAVTSAKLASGVGGKVLQFDSVTKTDTSSVTTNATPQDISGLSITLSNVLSTSKIYITGKVQMSLQYATTGNIHINVNGTEQGTAPSSYSRPVAHTGTGYLGVGQQYGCYAMAFDLEVDSSTSVVAGSNTIKLQMSQPDTTSGHTLYINRSQTDPNGVAGPRYVSTLSVFEIAP
tara:strand:- start:51 stop:671 length:621 start_codon:yes stop_codon:yes gene_type:complete